MSQEDENGKVVNSLELKDGCLLELSGRKVLTIVTNLAPEGRNSTTKIPGQPIAHLRNIV